MTANRDYDAELKDTADHRYAYNFDFDVMHKYMVRSFEPFWKKGSPLELGSFKSDFTKRLLPHFDDIACVEASIIWMVASCWASNIQTCAPIPFWSVKQENDRRILGARSSGLLFNS